MHKISRALIFLSLVAAFAFGVSPAEAQKVKCDPLPKVEWWSQSHAKVIATVDKRYKGDWEKYIARWEKYGSRMEKTLAAKSVAVVKSRGIKLRWKILETHIKQVKERIKVLRCLSKSQASEPAKDKPKAKKVTRLGKKKVVEVSGKSLDLEVTAECENNVVTFQITNLGDRWPQLGSINIYGADNKALVSKRRMKLRNSQQVTFKISRNKAKKAKVLGLWIEPSWFKRPFKYDIKQSCW